jgi:hypothetical protein
MKNLRVANLPKKAVLKTKRIVEIQAAAEEASKLNFGIIM